MKKILLSIATVGVLSALVYVGFTGAFFSDTEMSSGNQFLAGSVDLKVDSECHYYELVRGTPENPQYEDVGCGEFDPDGPQGSLPPIPVGYWNEKDLLGEKFFYFQDLKPGDWGENTISLHVLDNDAWGRIRLNDVVDDDNTCNDPESEEELDCLPGHDGELDNYLRALVWLDQGQTPGFQGENDPREGDNIWQREHEPLIEKDITDDFSYDLDQILSQAYVAAFNGGANPDTLNLAGLYADGRMRGSITYYLGVGWCFGDYNLGTGFCDGSSVGNDAQTDLLAGDLIFEVVQHRNNPQATFSP